MRKLASCAAALLLAACETTSGPPPAPESGSSVSMPSLMPENQVAAVAPPVIEPSYIPSTDELVGASEGRVRELVGAPTLVRAEQNSAIWQYRTNTCVLFLFFYPGNGDALAVNYLTSSGARSGEVTPGDQACVEAVTRAAANASSGVTS